MFNKISISGFKGIVDLDLFKIPRILLIGGQNNIGKSSILEAIFMALDRSNPELLMRHFSFRGIGMVTLNEDSSWRPAFNNYDLNRPIIIKLCDTKNKCLEFIIRYDPNFTSYNIQDTEVIASNTTKPSNASTSTPAKTLHITAKLDHRQVQDSHLIILPQGLSYQVKYAEASKVSGIYLSSVSRNLLQENSVRYGQLDVENKTGPVLDIVRLIDPRVTNLSVVAIGESSEIHATIDGFQRKIPISLMGDGIGRILSITLAIFVSQNGVVLVDEIENGLHHSKLAEFWTAITKACITANCQIIATTHNYECLSAASKSTSIIDKDCFSYVRLERKKGTEKLIAIQYSGDELSNALEAEFEVR